MIVKVGGWGFIAQNEWAIVLVDLHGSFAVMECVLTRIPVHAHTHVFAIRFPSNYIIQWSLM